MPKNTPLQLGERELDALFPFRLVVDAQARLISIGPALARFAPELEPGDRFVNHLIVERPGLTIGHLTEWFEEPDPNVLFILRRRVGGWLMRGQWVAHPEQNRYTFLGVPALRDEEDLANSGLQVSDFAPADSIGTYLALSQNSRRIFEESRTQWERNRSRSNDLENRLIRSEEAHQERTALLNLLATEAAKVVTDGPSLGLVEEVLRLSEAESGHVQLESREYSPRELIREVLTRVRASLAHEPSLELNGGVEASLPESVYGPFERQAHILSTMLLAAARTADSSGLSIKLRRDRELGPEFGFRAEIAEDRGSISEELAAHLTSHTKATPPGIAALQGRLPSEIALVRQWTRLLGGRFELNLAIQGFQRLFICMPWANARAVRDGFSLPFPDRVLLVGSPGAAHLVELESQLERLGSSTRWASDLGQAMDELQESGSERPFGALFLDRALGADLELRVQRMLLTAPRPHPAMLAVSSQHGQGAPIGNWGNVQLPVPDADLWKAVAEARRKSQSNLGSICSIRRSNAPRVLVVDRDPAVTRVISRVLSKVGALVEIVNDGLQAVEAWERLGHDLVLVELDLPTVSGAETIRRIRDLETRGRRARILGFDHPEPAHRLRALDEAGADGVLHKPLRVDVLQRMIEGWLQPAA